MTMVLIMIMKTVLISMMKSLRMNGECGDKEMANVGDKGNETNIQNMITI